MIEQFEVKPSALMSLCIVIVHVFTFFAALCFDLPILIYVAILLGVLVSLAWFIHTYIHRQCFFLKYESHYQRWSASNDAKQWQRYDSLNVAYINSTLVWIILASPGRVSKSSLISVDSMAKDKFLQLRRCILCPEMFD